MGNVLFIVDSIPESEEQAAGVGALKQNEIDRIEIVKNKEALNENNET